MAPFAPRIFAGADHVLGSAVVVAWSGRVGAVGASASYASPGSRRGRGRVRRTRWLTAAAFPHAWLSLSTMIRPCWLQGRTILASSDRSTGCSGSVWRSTSHRKAPVDCYAVYRQCYPVADRRGGGFVLLRWSGNLISVYFALWCSPGGLRADLRRRRSLRQLVAGERRCARSLIGASHPRRMMTTLRLGRGG